MSIGPRAPGVTVALDNDVLNDWRFRRPATVKAIEQYITVVKAPPAIPSITVFEMFHGFEKAEVKSGTVDPRVVFARHQTQSLISQCTILPFNHEAAEIAAHIFPRLSKKQRNELWADIFIASTALAHDHGVATRNRTDYELIAKYTPTKLPPLRIVVW